MCGRYVLDPITGKGVPMFPENVHQWRLGSRTAYAIEHDLAGYDIRPTTLCAVALHSETLTAARWGWARDFATGGRIINARWETVTEKRTFSEAAERRRCVIPATGYYEWRRDDRDRPLAKYAFLPAVEGTLLAMAGLYEDVAGPDGVERRFLVLTRPMARYAEIHDRTPVMLSGVGEDAWLNPSASMGDILEAARSMGDDDLVPRAVASGPTKARPAGAWLMDEVK